MTCRSPSPGVYDWTCVDCCVRALRTTTNNRQAALTMLWVIRRTKGAPDIESIKKLAWGEK